jgi:signal transduction histidine kinase
LGDICYGCHYVGLFYDESFFDRLGFEILHQIAYEIIAAWEDIRQPGAIHSSDECILANDAFASLFGYSRASDLSGRFMGEFLSPWPGSGVPRLGRKEATGRMRDGKRVEVEIVTLPLDPSEGVFQTLVKDISELKAWEDRMLQAERLTAMGKLAGEIAHEINNPLGGIMLYANLIKEDLPDDSQARKNVEKIVRLASKCRMIAKGLLNFGRSSPKATESVDLNLVIHEMFSLIEDHKIFYKVRCVFRLDQDLSHIMADKGQIEQVVMNLMINAAEAMKGEGEMIVETFNSPPPTRAVILRVKDTGPGIPDEIAQKIFEPFYTTKPPGRGTGLGLSITHGIVQRHGGKINVKPRQNGKGTCFEVCLPLNFGGR